jgi:hypothetical protein
VSKKLASQARLLHGPVRGIGEHRGRAAAAYDLRKLFHHGKGTM